MLLLPGHRLWQLDNKKVCVFKPFIIDAVVFDYPGRAFKEYLQSAATHLAHFGISGESQVACPNSHAHLGLVTTSFNTEESDPLQSSGTSSPLEGFPLLWVCYDHTP